MTTATFADYVAQQDARNTIQLNVTKWTLMLCDALKTRAPKGYDYIIESGRKYHKVIMVDSGNSRSVHCFIDKKTGEVYKSASWKAPAKGVRYDLRLIKDREWLLEHADWASGYLYAR
jgi:phage-related protein